MNIILLIVGVFCGIAVCIGTLYSVAQVILNEGRLRWVHFFAVVMMLTVMWFLLERDVFTARLLSPLLILALIGTFWVERRWYRILPILQGTFAILLIAGYVHF
ncbi:hypothetical protein KHP62_17760 [Rhodobacteraceae bacterium NNCM2]|nr:hypothetical protein [Coraliihabitans acroporae]